MIGIDAAIAEMNQHFTDTLWQNKGVQRDFFGRVFRNKDRDNKLMPQILKGREYQEVLFDDRVPVTCFYDCEDKAGSDQFQFQRRTGIIFIVNLTKLYPEITTHRPEQEAEYDVKQALSYSPAVFDDIETIYNIDSYGDFATESLREAANLHPWFVFRININLNYLLDNC